MSLWGSTVMLLHTYSKKLGKVKFWIIITIPIASFLSIFVIITPFVMSISSGSHDKDTIIEIIVVDALGYTLPALFSGILFGLPFWTIARSLNYNSALKDYMIIAGSGFALFEVAITGNVMLSPISTTWTCQRIICRNVILFDTNGNLFFSSLYFWRCKVTSSN